MACTSGEAGEAKAQPNSHREAKATAPSRLYLRTRLLVKWRCCDRVRSVRNHRINELADHAIVQTVSNPTHAAGSLWPPH